MTRIEHDGVVIGVVSWNGGWEAIATDKDGTTHHHHTGGGELAEYEDAVAWLRERHAETTSKEVAG